jgi:diguanylate cyclase (GGDEF)-like protein
VARQRYSNLEDIYGFTVKLSALADTEDVVTVALSEVQSTIRCRHVALRLPLGQEGIRFELDDTGEVQQSFGEMTNLERSITDGHGSVLAPRGRRDRMPRGYDFRDLMAAPVRLGDAGTAVMVVADHAVDSDTFDTEDLRFFEALAANLGTALTSSQRLDRLRAEVAAREHEALHDALTGLANRTLFGQWISDALAHRRPHQQVAVMVMDLDGFKDINDTLGHHTGDSILKEVGGRVLAAVGSDRMAARLGGDEFAFVIPAAASAEEALDVAGAILESVSRPVAIDGLVLELRASIGVALAPRHGTDSATLLRRADVAMYAAKMGKRGVLAYNHEIDQNTKRRLILATELRRAMDAKDLEVWYQPIANLVSGEIAGLEALLRWRHSHHGSISPNEFIPVAEQSGLIEPLTWWVMETALRELARWRQDGYELGMAVNVSARSLLGPEIVDRLGRLLSDVGTPPSDLTLEITESLMMTDPDGSERILTELAELGVKIAIDDFGTGYSSLSRLKRLPVQTVKIDRSFVLSMHRDEGDAAIVRATIELARNMGHSVIAEGVEQRSTWERLAELGCDQAQGHLLAAAMPSDSLRKWIKARQAPALAPIRVLPSATRRGA